MVPMRLLDKRYPIIHLLFFTLLLLHNSVLLPCCRAAEDSFISSEQKRTATSTTTTAAFQPLNPNNKMRAWTCHGRNQKQLVENLSQAMIIQSPAVRDVMYQVDRIHYSPPNSNPYQDAPQVLGWGQTISAPHMHAHALEEIYPYLKRQYDAHPNEPLKVLDVGCGSGYLTACFGRWFSPSQRQQQPEEPEKREPVFPAPNEQQQHQVYGIDIHHQLVQVATDNMKKADADLIDNQVVHLQTANGWQGLPSVGPFDAIHVGASAADFPTDLAQQLKPGGVLVVPVGPQTGAQYLFRVERLVDDEEEETKQQQQQDHQDAHPPKFNPKDFEVTRLLGVRYVPLVKGKPAP